MVFKYYKRVFIRNYKPIAVRVKKQAFVLLLCNILRILKQIN